MTSPSFLSHARHIFETKDLGQGLTCSHRFISIPPSLVYYLSYPAHIQRNCYHQAIRRKSNRQSIRAILVFQKMLFIILYLYFDIHIFILSCSLFRLYSYQRCARRRVRPLLLDPFHLYHPTSLVPACWKRGRPSGGHGLECGGGRRKKIRVLLPVGWFLSLFPSM